MENMKNDILDKLKDHCSCELNSECQIVYLLVEIRKFLDYNKNGMLYKKQCPFLRICCSWAVHIKIDDTKPFKEMFEQIDKKIQEYYDENKDEETLKKQISNIILLKKFKDQLSDFLENFNIRNITSNKQEWEKFIQSFLSVVSDCPLVKVSEHIEQFSISKDGKWEMGN